MKGAFRDLIRGAVIQVDDRSVFSASPDPTWVDAVVIDLFSSQFTVTIDEHTHFRFYRDKDNTWQFKP